MLDKVKKVLRITTDDFDEEINDLIADCKVDLKLSGIREEKIDEDDELIRRSIIVYCKAHFGWENPDYERLLESYHALKTHLNLSTEYGHVVE